MYLPRRSLLALLLLGGSACHKPHEAAPRASARAVAPAASLERGPDPPLAQLVEPPTEPPADSPAEGADPPAPSRDEARRARACDAPLLRDGASPPLDPDNLLFYVNRWNSIPASYPVSNSSSWTPCSGGDPPAPPRSHDMMCVPAGYTHNTSAALRQLAFESPAPGEPSTTFDGLPVGLDGKVGFKALIDAARAEGHTLLVRSAFRSYSNQAATFRTWIEMEMARGRTHEQAEEKASTYSARAGHSEHQLGTTVDLVYRVARGGIYEGWDPETIARSPAIQWVMANAHRFGIVLTYDRDHVEVTQYVWEPWHYRFVGVEAADAMRRCSLSTEEFLNARYRAGPLPEYEPRRLRSARR